MNEETLDKKMSQMETKTLAQALAANASLAGFAGQENFTLPVGELLPSHDESLEGDGTPENPLKVNIEEIEHTVTEEVEEAVDTIKSKIVYTLDLGAVQTGIAIQGNGTLFAKATLFSPGMDQEINDTDSKIMFATNQTGSVSKLIFALYRYDLADNTIHWVANTDNVASLVSTTGLHVAPIKYVASVPEGSTLQLKSNKLYYLVVFTDANGVKIAGNTYSETMNTIPLLGWYADNLQDVTAESIKNTYSVINPNGENCSRLFAAISNIAIESASTPVATGPFTELSNYAVSNSKRIQSVAQALTLSSSGMVFQKVVPAADVDIVAWQFLDYHGSQPNHYGALVLDSQLTPVNDSSDTSCTVGDNDGTKEGNFYVHKYEKNSGSIHLTAGETYWFPAIGNGSNQNQEWLIQYSSATPSIPTRDLLLVEDCSNLGNSNNETVVAENGCYLKLWDNQGNTYQI